MTSFFTSPQGRKLAYNKLDGKGPEVVFLGGFKSDMQGTKAIALEEWAKATGRAFLRFDYSGHGESDGAFEDGCIGEWLEDARAAIAELTDGPVILVGSSMGGWIATLIARDSPDVAGMVGIAAAPDFTKNGFWAAFGPAERETVLTEGSIALPSAYGDPYVITRKLIEDGSSHLVLESPLDLHMPVRLLQGTADEDVPVEWAMRLLNHAEGADIRLTLVKAADHRFSTPECLQLIIAAVEEVLSPPLS